eukprot:CAMPEP_0118836894 /NCGR_PEP_ID=MMETSP1162-20130426/60557_1 /TAXON_ID=33656 /ORGANISM="Phaeocystis Sp, Strain CCMP2710" /LENGTH=198 /DNA_ID=CAMNT_0006768745 /DNA_START=42 /DNA_END=635 /DNA_ORIENTATION=-
MSARAVNPCARRPAGASVRLARVSTAASVVDLQHVLEVLVQGEAQRVGERHLEDVDRDTLEEAAQPLVTRDGAHGADHGEARELATHLPPPHHLEREATRRSHDARHRADLRRLGERDGDTRGVDARGQPPPQQVVRRQLHATEGDDARDGGGQPEVERSDALGPADVGEARHHVAPRLHHVERHPHAHDIERVAEAG